MATVLVILSGGQDSTTCLYHAKHAGHTVHAVTFDYAQRHSREIDAARKVAALAKIASHEVVKLGPILLSTSPLVSTNKLEQYSDHRSRPGGVEKTFVPLRNQLFLTIAANRAVALKATQLWIGVSQEDFGGYPDCRQSFITSLEEAINLGTWGQEPNHLRIVTPLMDRSKKQTVELALTLPGCYGALAWSHTGYDGAFPPTGHDHATLLRAKGFEEANVPDPLILRAVTRGLMNRPSTRNYSPDLVRSFSQRLVTEKGLG